MSLFCVVIENFLLFAFSAHIEDQAHEEQLEFRRGFPLAVRLMHAQVSSAKKSDCRCMPCSEIALSRFQEKEIFTSVEWRVYKSFEINR